jgi:AraC-like DNA-binding protein
LLLPDESLTLAVGSVFLIAPQVKHVEKSPGVMSIIWVGLDGTMMEDQTSAHPKTVQSDSLIPLFEEMIQISWQPRRLVGPILDGLAHVLLGSFLQQINEPKRSELDYRLEWAAEYLRHNYARSVSMMELAQACKCSEGHFYRSFHQYFGISPRRFLETLRMKQATKLLLHSDARVEEIARDVGFDDPLYFSRAFRRFYNQSPLQIRKSLRQQEHDPPAIQQSVPNTYPPPISMQSGRRQG